VCKKKKKGTIRGEWKRTHLDSSLDAFLDANEGLVAQHDSCLFEVVVLVGRGVPDFFGGEEDRFVQEFGDELGEGGEEEGQEGRDDNSEAGIGVDI
jgi:hypothetical protein